jgi:hypothetical protein
MESKEKRPQTVLHAVAQTSKAIRHRTMPSEVNEKGAAVNIKVEKASDDGWAHDVTDALREWKFTPGRKGGAPIAIPCTMDFARAN